MQHYKDTRYKHDGALREQPLKLERLNEKACLITLYLKEGDPRIGWYSLRSDTVTGAGKLFSMIRGIKKDKGLISSYKTFRTFLQKRNVRMSTSIIFDGEYMNKRMQKFYEMKRNREKAYKKAKLRNQYAYPEGNTTI